MGRVKRDQHDWTDTDTSGVGRARGSASMPRDGNLKTKYNKYSNDKNISGIFLCRIFTVPAGQEIEDDTSQKHSFQISTLLGATS